jgi:hypothetical protein
MSSVLALAADPFVAKWKPNVGKSKFIIGGPTPRNDETLKLEFPTGGRFREIRYRPDGTIRTTIEFVLDGRVHPGASGEIWLKSKRINQRTISITSGSSKRTVVIQEVVSADRKTSTNTRKGSSAATGEPVDEILVFDRQ